MRPNAWVGLVAIVLGAAYGIQALGLPRARIGDPLAPLYFPIGLGALMFVLGAIAFIIEARKGLTSGDRSKWPQFHLHSMKLILYVIVLCLAYTAVFDHIGFILSTLPFLLIMLLVINTGASKFMQNLLISALFTFGMWYIFVHVFQISLPTAPSSWGLPWGL